MSLVLKMDICPIDNCRGFTWSEQTGAYASDNLTGWNAPNEQIAFVTAAVLEVFKPGNTTTTADLTIDLFAESPNWATVDTTQEYTITNTALGYSGRVTDGIWKFVYTVTATHVDEVLVYKQTAQRATYCNAKCCVDGLFGEIEDFECDCMEAAISKALTAQAIYKSMVSAASCGNITKFNKLKSMLERMCNNQDCCS